MQNIDMFDLLLIIIKISGGGIRVARRRQDEATLFAHCALSIKRTCKQCGVRH
jgi:hypothetical protein